MRRISAQLLRLVIGIVAVGVLVAALSIARDLREMDAKMNLIIVAIDALEAR